MGYWGIADSGLPIPVDIKDRSRMVIQDYANKEMNR